MKKRIFATFLLAVMLLSLLAGCGNKKTEVLTAEEAQAVALEHAGLTKDQATDIHTHIVTENGTPCFSVHITSTQGDYSYVISVVDGSILSGGKGSGH